MRYFNSGSASSTTGLPLPSLDACPSRPNSPAPFSSALSLPPSSRWSFSSLSASTQASARRARSFSPSPSCAATSNRYHKCSPCARCDASCLPACRNTRLGETELPTMELNAPRTDSRTRLRITPSPSLLPSAPGLASSMPNLMPSLNCTPAPMCSSNLSPSSSRFEVLLCFGCCRIVVLPMLDSPPLLPRPRSDRRDLLSATRLVAGSQTQSTEEGAGVGAKEYE
mmetsp:Transcript_33367/g.75375  ORF Transcript_33367/g.75375 Transcript_33367/m.75375 type:complete len:226 (+) Transcript_33367:1373-2050(+)